MKIAPVPHFQILDLPNRGRITFLNCSNNYLAFIPMILGIFQK